MAARVERLRVRRLHHRGCPDYFMFGDSHTNYYEGEVYYDDVRLDVPR